MALARWSSCRRNGIFGHQKKGHITDSSSICMDPRAGPKPLDNDIVHECTERDGIFPRKIPLKPVVYKYNTYIT